MALYLAFSAFGWYSPLDNETAGQILAICLAVALVQYPVDILPLHSNLLQALFYFVIMCVVVFGLGGGVFHLFGFHWQALLTLGVMLVLVFFITFALSYYGDYKKAKHINEMIEREQHRVKNM